MLSVSLQSARDPRIDFAESRKGVDDLKRAGRRAARQIIGTQ